MTHGVIWEPQALQQAERFARKDPAGVQQVFTAVDHLAGNPRPKSAYGSSDLLRIHVGRYRVMYEISDRQVRVNVIHLGRVA
ncbi:type II toxin-antitoxin system RelE family toxin [Streptomyces sp. MS19]|uniref:type II toxin-antitoxin system RelE family toxin n=1 Tax=Streptomyces sp. MS19 TaxID=3385972 RepID=UPI0039A2D6F1